MAKDILYIEEGATIDVTWTGHIVISSDGINWNGINTAGLSVGKHYISLNNSVENSFPERNKETGWVIVLKHIDSDGAVLKFNPANVVNQATWNTGATDPTAGSITAVDDIMSWIG